MSCVLLNRPNAVDKSNRHLPLQIIHRRIQSQVRNRQAEWKEYESERVAKGRTFGVLGPLAYNLSMAEPNCKNTSGLVFLCAVAVYYINIQSLPIPVNNFYFTENAFGAHMEDKSWKRPQKRGHRWYALDWRCPIIIKPKAREVVEHLILHLKDPLSVAFAVWIQVWQNQISLNKQMKKAISNTPNRMKIVFEALSE